MGRELAGDTQDESTRLEIGIAPWACPHKCLYETLGRRRRLRGRAGGHEMRLQEHPVPRLFHAEECHGRTCCR